MRADFVKVLGETPRGGSHLRNRKHRRRYSADEIERICEYQDDEGPVRAPHSPGKINYGRKSRGISSAPMKRFLRSNLGRPWNQVYSDICQRIDRRSAVGREALDLLDYLVTKHCFEDADGGIRRNYSPRSQPPVEGFYIHPRTQLLCYARVPYPVATKPAYTQEENNRFGRYGIDPLHTEAKILDDHRVVEKINGIWYVHAYVHHDQSEMVTGWEYSALQKQMVLVRKTRAQWRLPEWERVSTRQLGKKALRKHGLRN